MQENINDCYKEIFLGLKRGGLRGNERSPGSDRGDSIRNSETSLLLWDNYTLICGHVSHGSGTK